jgi:hypothetical protein
MVSKVTVVYASHHQFYVQDSAALGNTAEPSFWTEDAVNDRIAIADGIVGVGTGSFGFVKVKLEVHNSKPPLRLSQWDHVTEAGLKVRSKIVLVFGCLSDTGVFFRVYHEGYRVRCCHANLAESVEHGDGGDRYLVQMWPGSYTGVHVLKRWPGR